MAIKGFLFQCYLRTCEIFTLLLPPKKCCNLTTNIEVANRVDIVTVAFNNAELIRLQYETFCSNLLDSYHQIIVDNSTNAATRDEIFAFCQEKGLTYIGLPKNFLQSIGGSRSHATALNYIYKRLIRKRNPAIFGIVDHDCFPTRPVSIAQLLESQPFYGILRYREPFWYISPILSFFSMNFIKKRHIDFFPIKPKKIYLDTGGGNWYSIYRHFDMNALYFPNEEFAALNDKEVLDYHSDQVAWIDNKAWLHLINGSSWKAGSDGALEKKKEILNEILFSKYQK